MGEHIKLTASDGVSIGAYVAKPAGTPKGGIVVIQEIFGVNHHIRAVADFYASQGYLAVAPAVYDRVEPDFECGYTQDDVKTGAGIRGKLDNAKLMLDLNAAVAEAAKAGKVGVVGYCFGGTMAYASACHIGGVAAASCYYGGGACAMANDKPKCPVIMHFGETDASIVNVSVPFTGCPSADTTCHVTV